MSKLSTDMHPLLTQDIIKLLFAKGIHNVLNFLDCEIKKLVQITNLTYKEVIIIRKHIINKNSAVTRNALDYYKELLTNSAVIPTGIKAVDSLLEGGLSTGNIYELCGLPASGKTQFCLTLAKNVAQNLKQSIIYIDTKGDFCGRKIKEMLNHQENITDIEIGQLLSRILVKKINTIYQLINALYEIKSDIHSKKLKLRVIIIDSLPPLFNFSSNHFKNYPLMNYLANILRFLANEYHVVFIITNYIRNWYEGDFKQCISYTEKIALGNYWLSVPNVRLKISECGNTNCEIVIVKSIMLTFEKKCIVNISNSGM